MESTYKIILPILLTICTFHEIKSQNVNDTILRLVDINDSTCFKPYYDNDSISLFRFCSMNSEICGSPITYDTEIAKIYVYIQFDIDKNGNTLNHKILKFGKLKFEYGNRDNYDFKIDYECCKEQAIKTLKIIKFNPATRNGLNTYYEGYILPIITYYNVALPI